MSSIYTVPDWLYKYLHTWRGRLMLEHWKLDIAIELCVADDPNTRASCTCDPNVNRADLRFRADVEDTAAWRITAIHELLHVAHGRVDHVLTNAVFDELPAAAQQLAHTVYEQQMEAFVEGLATVLYRTSCKADFPDEYKTL